MFLYLLPYLALPLSLPLASKSFNIIIEVVHQKAARCNQYLFMLALPFNVVKESNNSDNNKKIKQMHITFNISWLVEGTHTYPLKYIQYTSRHMHALENVR